MDVVILGRIGYDLYSEEPHVPLPQVRRFSRYLGGSSANMAVGLARLGADVGIIGCLGTDALSEFLVDFLRTEKVDTSRVQQAAGFLPSLFSPHDSPPISGPHRLRPLFRRTPRPPAAGAPLLPLPRRLERQHGRRTSPPRRRCRHHRLPGHRRPERISGGLPPHGKGRYLPRAASGRLPAVAFFPPRLPSHLWAASVTTSIPKNPTSPCRRCAAS